MKILYCWESGVLRTDDHRTNPYGALLRGGLEERGHQVTGETYYKLRFRALLSNRHAGVLHVNHAYHYYKHPSRAVSLLRLARLAIWLLLARLLRMRIVWTLHNLYPHESRSRRIDWLCRRLLCRTAGAVIVHCQLARRVLKSEFGRSENVHVIPHGNYVDAYPPSIPKHAARATLGLPADANVALYFGNVRSYKGIDDLLEAFLGLGLPGAHLLIAGKIWPEFEGFEEHWTGRPEAVGRVTRMFKPSGQAFTGDEIRDLMSAADIVVLPFRQVLSSGSVMLALSYGKPVVCPRLGCLGELLDGCEGAVLYDSNDPSGLADGLRRAGGLDLASASKAAMARAMEMNWNDIAKLTEAAYTSA